MELFLLLMIVLGAVAIAAGHLWLTYRRATDPAQVVGCHGNCASCGLASSETSPTAVKTAAAAGHDCAACEISDCAHRQGK